MSLPQVGFFSFKVELAGGKATIKVPRFCLQGYSSLKRCGLVVERIKRFHGELFGPPSHGGMNYRLRSKSPQNKLVKVTMLEIDLKILP